MAALNRSRSGLLWLLLRRNDATVTTLWLFFSRSLEICRSCFLIKQAAWKFDCSVNLIGESGGEVMWYGNRDCCCEHSLSVPYAAAAAAAAATRYFQCSVDGDCRIRRRAIVGGSRHRITEG